MSKYTKAEKKARKARQDELLKDLNMFTRPKFTGSALIAVAQIPADENIEAVFPGERDNIACLMIATDRQLYVFGANLKGTVDERIPYARIDGVTQGGNRKGTYVTVRDGNYEVTVGNSLSRKSLNMAEVIRSHAE